MERLPERRGEGEQEVPAQVAPAPVQSALGVDLGQPAALDVASVLALQPSAGNAAVTAMMPNAPGPAVGTASNPEATSDRPVAAENSVQRELARSVQRRGQSLQHEDHGAAEASGSQPAFRSPALVLRSRLRSGGSGRAMLHRAIVTSGGEWDTDKYDLLRDVDQAGQARPPAQGIRGVDIKLKFSRTMLSTPSRSA